MNVHTKFEWQADAKGEGGMATFHFSTGKCEVRFTHFNAAHTLNNWIQQDRYEVHQYAQRGAYAQVIRAVKEFDV